MVMYKTTRKQEKGERCKNIDTASGVRVVQGEGVCVHVPFGWSISKILNMNDFI